jgi:hypothetical protein
LQTLPGFDELGAALLLVEIGDDMQAFGKPEKLRHYVATAHDPARPSRDNLTLSDNEGPESWRNRMY